MISLQTVLLLCIGISHAVAWDPNCTQCDYYNGIGFVKSDEFCAVYYMCVRNVDHPDYYRHYVMCCAVNMTFDVEHKTCRSDPYCDDSRAKCPDIPTVSEVRCPNYPDPWDTSKYIVPTGEQMMCPYGQVWSQPDCTCVRGDVDFGPPCEKILHYDFNDTYDSWSCYNHAAGVPYGYPPLTDNMLCLNGVDQFLTIPFLNNYFAWNPLGKTFTLCFWFRAFAGQTAGLLSTNCYAANEDSVLEVYLVDGELVVKLLNTVCNLGVFPTYDYWYKLCITYNRGEYIVYYNGVEVKRLKTFRLPFNSHSDTTLGFVTGKNLFYGYIDDFCFYTIALDAVKMLECYYKGPSNGGPYLGTPP